jgi:hypothetical protein
MKKSLVIFCSLTLIITVTVTAYNSDKGPSKLTEGITELPLKNDSLVQRGKELLKKSNYSEQDLQAIAAYLNNH